MNATTASLPEDLRQALDQAVAAIVEIAHPQLIILFGSWAEGKAREDSDVDLLVVADTEDWLELTETLDSAIRPFLGMRSIDLLVYSIPAWRKDSRLPGFPARQADRKGRRLYAA